MLLLWLLQAHQLLLRTHLLCCCQVSAVEWILLGLKLPCDHQDMVGHYVEFVEQQRVAVRQVIHPKLLLIWEKGVTECWRLLLLLLLLSTAVLGIPAVHTH